jgi:hypothetical protein
VTFDLNKHPARSAVNGHKLKLKLKLPPLTGQFDLLESGRCTQ